MLRMIKGNVVKVNFGDPNMEIKKDNPARRKSLELDTTATIRVHVGKLVTGHAKLGKGDNHEIY